MGAMVLGLMNKEELLVIIMGVMGVMHNHIRGLVVWMYQKMDGNI